jgi:hypothetical protein
MKFSQGRTPVAQQPRLDVFDGERLAQQRIVEQVDLAHRQVVGGAPPGVDAREFGFRHTARRTARNG